MEEVRGGKAKLFLLRSSFPPPPSSLIHVARINDAKGRSVSFFLKKKKRIERSEMMRTRTRTRTRTMRIGTKRTKRGDLMRRQGGGFYCFCSSCFSFTNVTLRIMASPFYFCCCCCRSAFWPCCPRQHGHPRPAPRPTASPGGWEAMEFSHPRPKGGEYRPRHPSLGLDPVFTGPSPELPSTAIRSKEG